MKLSDDWKDDLLKTIEGHALSVQLARVFRETLQVAGYSLEEIKQFNVDLHDEIEWLEILRPRETTRGRETNNQS